MTNPTPIHNQPIADPVAHFKAKPWCAKLLTDKSIIQTQVPDRTPLSSTESTLVRETLNTSSTVKACITFLRYIKTSKDEEEIEMNGEDKKNPFLQVCALLDLGSGVNGYAKTAHGGFFGVVLDEIMGTAANMQAAQGAFTASLTVKFKKPLFTPSIAVCRGRVVKKEGRKLIVKGSFEDKDGSVLAEAEGIWVMVNRDIGRWTDKREEKARL